MTITRLDVQTARIVVGNVLEGDDAADCDFLDTGNGAAIAAAIAAATGTTADIFIKSGTYDFNLPGAPGVLVVPPDMRVQGAARTGPSGGPYTGTTFLLTPTQRQLMSVGARSRVGGFTVEIPAAVGGAAGAAVVDLLVGSARAEHIQMDFTGPPANVGESLTAAFLVGSGGAIRFCGTRANAGYETAVGTLAAFRLGNSARALDCDGDGLDIGFITPPGTANVALVDCRAINNSGEGFLIQGSDVLITACRAIRDAAGRGFILEGDRCGMSNCEANGSSVGGTTGIQIEGSDNRVIACTINDNMISGIMVNPGALRNILGPNTFVGNTLNEDFSAAAIEAVRRVIPEFFHALVLGGGPIVTAEVGETIPYDNSAGAITIEAPPFPNLGAFFRVKDQRGVGLGAVTIDGNGLTIEAPTGGAIAATQAVGGIANLGATWTFVSGVWRVLSVP